MANRRSFLSGLGGLAALPFIPPLPAGDAVPPLTQKLVVSEAQTIFFSDIQPFRYVALYDLSCSEPMISYFWPDGQSITLAEGESFTAEFDKDDGILTIS